MNDVGDLLDVYGAPWAMAGVPPLPEDEIEEWLRAILADNIIGGAAVRRVLAAPRGFRSSG
jgi:hypothetical protein